MVKRGEFNARIDAEAFDFFNTELLLYRGKLDRFGVPSLNKNIPGDILNVG